MLSVIIITFNSIKFIKSCLDSIFNQDYSDFEVIVVDNGSNEGTASFIKENYSNIELIENKKNVGACMARNQAIEVSRGEWVLALDCDTILEKDFFRKIIEFANQQDETIGIVQPKILNMDKKTIYSCGIFLSWLRRFYDIGRGRIDEGQFDKSNYIFGACSATALYKRKMLENVRENTGYFDERFFFLVEDVDLAWRARRRGWKAIFYPQAICFHSGNSSYTSKKIREYFCFRNRYLMIYKNESFAGKLKLAVLSSWYEASRSLYLLFTNEYIWNPKKAIKNNY